MTERALQLARSAARREIGEVRTLLTTGKQLRGGHRLRVDLEKQSLVRTKEPTRGAAGKSP